MEGTHRPEVAAEETDDRGDRPEHQAEGQEMLEGKRHAAHVKHAGPQKHGDSEERADVQPYLSVAHVTKLNATRTNSWTCSRVHFCSGEKSHLSPETSVHFPHVSSQAVF